MSACKVAPKATKTSWVVLMLNIQPELPGHTEVNREMAELPETISKSSSGSIHAIAKVSHSSPIARGWGQVTHQGTKEERSNKARVLL